MGCSSLNVQSTAIPPPNSVTKCEQLVKDGHYKTFGEVLEKLIDTIGKYNDCAAKHNTLVDFEMDKNK